MSNRDVATAAALQNSRSDDPGKAGGGWELRVDRGPNWLFVTVTGGGEDASPRPTLAGQLTSLLEEHFSNRIVLQLNEVNLPQDRLLSELERLDAWIQAHDGVMRLCGLSASHARALRRNRLGQRYSSFGDREQAIRGGCPSWRL